MSEHKLSRNEALALVDGLKQQLAAYESLFAGVPAGERGHVVKLLVGIFLLICALLFPAGAKKEDQLMRRIGYVVTARMTKNASGTPFAISPPFVLVGMELWSDAEGRLYVKETNTEVSP